MDLNFPLDPWFTSITYLIFNLSSAAEPRISLTSTPIICSSISNMDQWTFLSSDSMNEIDQLLSHFFETLIIAQVNITEFNITAVF